MPNILTGFRPAAYFYSFVPPPFREVTQKKIFMFGDNRNDFFDSGSQNLNLLYVLTFILAWILFATFSYFYFSHLGLNRESLVAYLMISFITSLILGICFVRQITSSAMHKSENLNKILKETLHELNIPVSTIKANVTLLQKQSLDSKNIRRLERIDLASNKLLLQYTYLEYAIKRGIRKVEKRSFDAAMSIRDSLDSLQEQAKGRQIETDLHPHYVLADQYGFGAMLDNLIGNAIKYSPAGSKISIRLDSGMLEISDEGIGMDELTLVKIFDRFYQADPDSEGMGIGLSFVQNYAEEHGIILRVITRQGTGTTIRMDLKNVLIEQNS